MTSNGQDESTDIARTRMKRVARVALWVLGIPAALLVALFLRLLFGPMEVPFVKQEAERMVEAGMPESAEMVFGDPALALDNWFKPVLLFSPVRMTDTETGAKVEMTGLEVGFSPVLGLFGQPGVTITLVEPHLQVVQDLFGPRLTSLEMVEDETGTTVRVLEGEDVYPTVDILSEGLRVRGTLPETSDGVGLRSDNEWLMHNMEASEKSLADLLRQREQGKFYRLEIRDGTLEMLDSVYGLYRQFEAVQASITPGIGDRPTRGTFSAELAGNVTSGSFERQVSEEGVPTITTEVENIDFAALLPFLDDPDGIMALKGAGTLKATVRYAGAGGSVSGGEFDIDLTGTRVRVRGDYFPVESGVAHVSWQPRLAQFVLDETELGIGKSSAALEGVFVLGLDDVYGPTVGMSVTARNLSLHPNDMPAPRDTFDEVVFNGWSSPLYGALGIDRLVARKDGVELKARGRVDMVRAGLGVKLNVEGSGASADDLKRMWPYFISTGAREWFVDNVSTGSVSSGLLALDLPVGAMSMDPNVHKPLPEGALKIDLTGSGITFSPWAEMASIAVPAEMNLRVRDNQTSVLVDQVTLPTGAGDIELADGRFALNYADPAETAFSLTGEVSGSARALLAMTRRQLPGVLERTDLPVDVAGLRGRVSGNVQTGWVMDASSELVSLDYRATGDIDGFTSTEPIAGRQVSNGDLAFEVTPDGYEIGGTAEMDGLETEVELAGTLDGGDPELKVAASIDAAQFAEFGFDVSQFLTGDIKFTANPQANGDIDLSVDLTNARLTVTDLGLSKAPGVPGTLQASIHQEGARTDVSNIDLSAGTVRLQGGLVFDNEDGLVSADFTNFALNAGDSAKLSLAPIDGGYSVTVRGGQLDLKPLLRRYFALDQVSTGGPQATAVDQTIEVDVELDRAPGFYKVTAYNLDTSFRVRGEDIRNLSLQATFAEGSSVSVTTNPTEQGHVMSVAFNDLGTILRFANVYPRLAGGSGSMVMTTNSAQQVDRGEVQIREFALVDEDNVVQVLGNHPDSLDMIERQNRLDFRRARVEFVRRSDRIEVTEGLLNGDAVGGTMRGFIYTKARQYDLTGTYVPLFGLNNFFQKIPILGEILGGREGEGLVGVTFAIRGSLDQPRFLVNPASMLLPGVFRSLFEFRAEEAPREAPQQ